MSTKTGMHYVLYSVLRCFIKIQTVGPSLSLARFFFRFIFARVRAVSVLDVHDAWCLLICFNNNIQKYFIKCDWDREQRRIKKMNIVFYIISVQFGPAPENQTSFSFEHFIYSQFLQACRIQMKWYHIPKENLFPSKN